MDVSKKKKLPFRAMSATWREFSSDYCIWPDNRYISSRVWHFTCYFVYRNRATNL